jgi:hypothetical protein
MLPSITPLLTIMLTVLSMLVSLVIKIDLCFSNVVHSCSPHL